MTSTHAAAAKQIRQELKAAFPSVTFKVKSSSFSQGNAVDIYWTNGPTSAEVEDITGKYQYGHFDGMVDCYEYSNKRADVPQVMFVQTQRNISNDAFEAILKNINPDRAEVWMEFTPLSLICGACNAHTLPGDRFCPDCGQSLTKEEAIAA